MWRHLLQHENILPGIFAYRRTQLIWTLSFLIAFSSISKPLISLGFVLQSSNIGFFDLPPLRTIFRFRRVLEITAFNCCTPPLKFISSNVRNELKFAKISRKDLSCTKMLTMDIENLTTVVTKPPFYGNLQSWTKVLGQIYICGAFSHEFIYTCSAPPSTPPPPLLRCWTHCRRHRPLEWLLVIKANLRLTIWRNSSMRLLPKAHDESERILAYCFGVARNVRGKEFCSLILPFLKLNDIGL